MISVAPTENAMVPEPGSAPIVTIHRFRPAPTDVARFTRELTDHVRLVELPGLISARVVREHGSSRVAVVAEWDRLSREIVAVPTLFRDPGLAEIVRRSQESDFNAYVTTDAAGEPWTFD